MPHESFFLTIAGLGLSVAGFAGLIAALDRRPGTRSAVYAWRIRNIVLEGVLLTMAGVGIVAIHNVSGGDVNLAVRATAVVLALTLLNRNRPSNISGPAWEGVPTGQRTVTMVVQFAGAAGAVAVAVTGSLGWLGILFLFVLQGPISIFYNTIRDEAAGHVSEAEEPVSQSSGSSTKGSSSR